MKKSLLQMRNQIRKRLIYQDRVIYQRKERELFLRVGKNNKTVKLIAIQQQINKDYVNSFKNNKIQLRVVMFLNKEIIVL